MTTMDQRNQSPPTAAAGAPEELQAPSAPSFSRSAQRFMGDENGQAMVEFTLISTLLLFLVAGIIQFALNANASYFANLGNFYALRAGSVTQEYAAANFNGYNLQQDMESTARYFMMPAWWYEGDFLATFFAQQSINVTQAVNGNTLQSQTNFNYYMTMPIARNVIGAAMSGWGGGFMDNPMFQDAGTRGEQVNSTGLWMVNDQNVVIAEMATDFNDALAAFRISFPAMSGFSWDGSDPNTARVSMGSGFVLLRVATDARRPAPQNGNVPADPNQAHQMIIWRRTYN